MNIFKSTLDTRHQNGVIGPITQFDNATLELQILTGGQVTEPWNSPEFELIAMKRDMNQVREVDQGKFTVISKEDHKVRIDLKEQFLTCRGTVKMQLVIKDGSRLSTTIFYLSIAQSLDAAIIESIKDIKVLDDLDEVVESLGALEVTATNNEEKRQHNEKLREVAESNRQDEFIKAQNQRDVEFNEKMEEYREYVSGLEGIQGKPGETPQIQVNDTHIQIKYPSQQEWFDLIALEMLRGRQGLQGLQGETLQIQVNETHIQFKYPSQREWSDLVALDDLKGSQGIQGKDGKDGVNGKDGVDGRDGITPNIQIGTVTTLESDQKPTVTRRGTKENPVFDFGIPRGKDGVDGQDGQSGGNGRKLIAKYIHKSNKVVQPTSLDLESGIFTCENHGLNSNAKLMINIDTENFTTVRVVPKELFLKIVSTTWSYFTTEIIDENRFKLKGVSYDISANTQVDVNKFWFEEMGVDSIRITGLNPSNQVQIVTKGLHTNENGMCVDWLTNKVLRPYNYWLPRGSKIDLIPWTVEHLFSKRGVLNLLCVTDTVIQNGFARTNVTKSFIEPIEGKYKDNWNVDNSSYSFTQEIFGELEFKNAFVLDVDFRRNIRNGFTIEIYDLGGNDNEK